MTYNITRLFTKRYTDRKPWEGRIGHVEMEAEVASIKLNGKVLPESSVEYLLNFSLQSLQDSYASAESLTEGVNAFTAKMESLYDGTAGVRGGSGMSDIDRAEAYIAEQWYLAKNGKGTEKGDAFRKLEDDAKAYFVSKIIGALREKWDEFDGKVKARVEYLAEQRKRRAAEKAELAASKPSVDIDL